MPMAYGFSRRVSRNTPTPLVRHPETPETRETPKLQIVLAMAMLLSLPWTARAEDAVDAEAFCRKAGRNQAIFEMAMTKATAQAASAAGAVSCSWTFKPIDKPEIVVTLDSKLFAAPVEAWQAILVARLPDNHRGKKIEPIKIGDDALSRSTPEHGPVKQFEIEAAKGRRHFLLTVRPHDPAGELSYRITGASIEFLRAGIAGL